MQSQLYENECDKLQSIARRRRVFWTELHEICSVHFNTIVRLMRGWDINDSIRVHGPVFMYSFGPLISLSCGSDLHKIWDEIEQSLVLPARLLDFRPVPVASFRNQSELNLDRKSRPNFASFFILFCKNWSRGRPSKSQFQAHPRIQSLKHYWCGAAVRAGRFNTFSWSKF